MSLKYTIRYKIDISVNEDLQIVKGAKPVNANPIGITTELNGTKEEIQDRIAHEIDTVMFKLEDLYYGEE